jgi:hypothetical protein
VDHARLNPAYALIARVYANSVWRNAGQIWAANAYSRLKKNKEGGTNMRMFRMDALVRLLVLLGLTFWLCSVIFKEGKHAN